MLALGNTSLALLLSLGDSNPVWLPAAITPHPDIELIKPTAIAGPFAAVSHCPLAATKAIGQGWSPVSTHEALYECYSAQHILSSGNIQGGEVGAACSIVEHGHSVALHNSIRGRCDGLKSADENQC